jgi:hypothetical protein
MEVMSGRRRINPVIEEKVDRPVPEMSGMAALMLLVVVASAWSGSTGTTSFALKPAPSVASGCRAGILRTITPSLIAE